MTMQESREPQQANTGSIAYPPVYTAPQNPYYPPAPPVKISVWTRFWRMNRLLLRRLLRGSMVVGRVLRPYAATLIVAIVLLGVIGWMSYLLWGPKAGVPSFQRANAIPPAGAIETFMQGQQSFNADMMWDAYSTDYQATQLASGASKATLQAMTTARHNQGFQYVHYDYIGGVAVGAGSMYFYSVDLTVQNQHHYIPIIFQTDADGKIVDISSPLYPPPPSSNQ
jgi:hypothetical protein